MPNPMLNDKVLEESRAGWAAPTPPSPGGQTWPAPVPGAVTPPPSVPMSDGPVSPWKGAMTVKGTINATAVLLGLLIAAGAAGWAATPTKVQLMSDGTTQKVAEFPPIALLGILVGFGCAIALRFKPHLAKFLGPIYTLGFGFAVGAISKGYEALQTGIVLQAVGATVAVFAVMLVLYRTRILKVTDRFRRAVITATLGIMVFYGVSLRDPAVRRQRRRSSTSPRCSASASASSSASSRRSTWRSTSTSSRRAPRPGLAKDFEWYAAFGLMVTIVWLYLEILRLLSKLNQR